MAQADIRAKLIEALEREAAAHGIDIVDVELTGPSRAQTITVRLDWLDEAKPAPTLDELGEQSRWVSRIVEDIDPIATSYTLDVSSPGLDRPLRRLQDFERFAGCEVVLTTNAYEGRKHYTGELKGVRAGKVVVLSDNEEFTFDLSEIKRCKIKPTIDFKAQPQK